MDPWLKISGKSSGRISGTGPGGAIHVESFHVDYESAKVVRILGVRVKAYGPWYSSLYQAATVHDTVTGVIDAVTESATFRIQFKGVYIKKFHLERDVIYFEISSVEGGVIEQTYGPQLNPRRVFTEWKT